MNATANTTNLTDGMRLTVEALKKNGIDTIFGVVGIPVTDLARYAQKEGIRYIGFRHEQSAGNAAAASGFITGRPGILLTVSAPGFLNGLGALANATVNGFPMIQISGSSDRAIIDLEQGDYEGLDQLNIARPFAKAAYRVNRPEDICTGLVRAVRAAVSGRPGGVYLDLTTAMLAAELDRDTAAASLFSPVDPAPAVIPSADAVERALKLLSAAEKPLVILGKGAAYAQADREIREFVETTGVPYLPMSMAKGLLPDDHPQSAAAARSFVLENADVVMLVGARLNWLLTHGRGRHWNPHNKFIQLDIDPVEIDSNRPIAAPVVGDIASSVRLLLNGLERADKLDLAYGYIPRGDIEETTDGRTGPDPELAYAGDPAAGLGFYCFAQPVAQGANAYLAAQGSALRAVDITGVTGQGLLQYLRGGDPVIVWITKDLSAPRTGGYTWLLADTGETYVPYANLHCVVLAGWDGDTCTIADPLQGRRRVDAAAFLQCFRQMGSRAVVVH